MGVDSLNFKNSLILAICHRKRSRRRRVRSLALIRILLKLFPITMSKILMRSNLGMEKRIISHMVEASEVLILSMIIKTSRTSQSSTVHS